MNKLSYLILTFLFAQQAQSQSWQKLNSPTGGTATDLLVKNQRLLMPVDRMGVFISDDNGNNWVASNTGLSNKNTYRISKSNDSVFVCTAGGIFLSTDSGNTWSKVFNQVSRAYYFFTAGGVYFINQSDTLLRSTNGGATWTPSLKVPGNSLFNFAFYNTLSGTLTVSVNNWVYQTANLGITWQNMPVPAPNNQAGFCSIGNHLISAMAGNYRILHRELPSSKWDTAYYSIALGSLNNAFEAGGKVYAIVSRSSTNSMSILHSVDSGKTWSVYGTYSGILNVTNMVKNGSDLFITTSLNLAFKVTPSSLLPIGKNIYGLPLLGIVSQNSNLAALMEGANFSFSTNGGGNWDPIGSNFQGDLVLYDLKNDTLYSLGYYSCYFDKTQMKWQKFGSQTYSFPSAAAIGSDRIYVASNSISGVPSLRYTDKITGFVNTFHSYSSTESITAMLSTENAVYATMNTGMIYAYDIADGQQELASKSVSPMKKMIRGGSFIYALPVEPGSGIYKIPLDLANGTVKQITSSLGNPLFREICFRNSTLYGLTQNGKLYFTRDSGDSWVQVPLGNIPSDTLTGLTVNNTTVYISTYLSGIWYQSRSAVLSVADKPSKISTENLYPNPVKDFIHVRVTEKGEVRFYDYTGKICLQKHIDGITQEFDVSDLPSGIYLVAITGISGKVEYEKIIKQ